MPLELPSSPPFALPLVLLPWPEPAEAAGTSGGDTTAPGVNPGPAPPEAPLPGGGRVAAGGEEDGIRAGGWEEWPLLPRRLDGFFTGLGFWTRATRVAIIRDRRDDRLRRTDRRF